MSAFEVTSRILDRLSNYDDDFILVNYANPDMVGHTGDLNAVIKAVEVVDDCVGRRINAFMEKDVTVIIGADHGNAETMIDIFTDEKHTYHTTNPVLFFVISKNKVYKIAARGILADIAPTIIDLIGLNTPDTMTGKALSLTN